MGYEVGFDANWNRDVGYAVPSMCDHPGCKIIIHRGISCVCGGDLYGGDRGCGLYFCFQHTHYHQDGTPLCERCVTGQEPFEPTSDRPEWMRHKLEDPSWAKWREENPNEVEVMRLALHEA